MLQAGARAAATARPAAPRTTPGTAAAIPPATLRDRRIQGMGSTAPSSASGVTTTETTGMATALASGPASETWPKSSSAAGASPTVMRPLHAPPLRDATLGQAPACRDVEDQRHRAKGKPEAGRERRPRVGRDHHGERQRQRAQRRGDAPDPQRERHHAHHVEGALRRHGEAGEQRVAERGRDGGERGRFARRQPQGCAPAGAASPGRRAMQRAPRPA